MPYELVLSGLIGAVGGSYITHRLTVRRENENQRRMKRNTRKVLLTGLKNLDELDKDPEEVNPSTIALEEGLDGAAFGYIGSNIIELSEAEIDALTDFQESMITFNTRVERGMRDFEPRFNELKEKRKHAIQSIKNNKNW